MTATGVFIGVQALMIERRRRRVLPRVDLVTAGQGSRGHGMAMGDKGRDVHVGGIWLLLRRVQMGS